MNDKKTIKTPWHVAFGEVLGAFFHPMHLSVEPNVSVMGKLPEADILLFRPETPKWTNEQRQRLPDGIRQSQAHYILIEFKYTESVTQSAFVQAQAYEYFYKQYKSLKDKDIQTFVVTAKKPRYPTRKKWGYEQAVYPGVYKSNHELLKRIPLISLNELSAKLHNAYFKLFASHKVVRERVFKQLERNKAIPTLPEPLESLLSGLRLLKGEEDMNIEMTPEFVQEMGRKWGKEYLARLPLEKRLAGIKPADRLAGIKVADRLAGIKVADRLAGIKPAEIEAYLKQRKAKR